jgi:predicted ATPase
LEKTAGNPFFIEEMVQALVEQGILVRNGDVRLAQPLTTIQIPLTVQGVLAARIDRLTTDDKVFLQTLAVIGNTFTMPLLRQVIDLPETALYEGLAHLQAAEFLYEQPAFPEPEYTFKHALTQEVAYNSLLLERRRALHERTAQAIEALYVDNLDEHIEALAHHYRHSGNVARAVTYLQRAARQAAQRAAYGDAIAHLSAALDLLANLPDTPERAQRELTLQIALGTPLMAARGYAAAEVEQAFIRSRELCQRLEDAPQLVSVLQRGWTMYLNRAELATARELAEQLLALAQNRSDARLLMLAHFELGVTLHHLGVLDQAREHLEQAITMYDSQQYRSQRGLQNPKTTSLSYLALILLSLGYPEQARQTMQTALTLAEELAHPNTLASSLGYASVLHEFLRDVQGVREQSDACVTICTEHGLQLFLSLGKMLRGWAAAMQGQVGAGIAELQQGLDDYRAQGGGLTAHRLAELADIYRLTGQTQAGLDVLSEALSAEERVMDAELYRLRGQLLQQTEDALREGDVTPEQCFQQALDCARQQQAKWWELRAAVSLARLWQQRGKRQEARALLAPIYGWYTEGFDTVDLQEARLLLDELT